jgi:hypothetical protein
MTIRDLRPALRQFLLADASIAAVVGTRVFVGRMPQGERNPSIVYNRISDTGYHVYEGPLGFARPRMQIDAWAETPDEAAALSNLVKSRLDGFSGLMGDVTVQGALFDSLREMYDPEAELYRVSTDYLILHVEDYAASD